MHRSTTRIILKEILIFDVVDVEIASACCKRCCCQRVLLLAFGVDFLELDGSEVVSGDSHPHLVAVEESQVVNELVTSLYFWYEPYRNLGNMVK